MFGARGWIGLGEGLPQGGAGARPGGKMGWWGPGTGTRPLWLEPRRQVCLHKAGCRCGERAGVHSRRCPTDRIPGPSCTDACSLLLPPSSQLRWGLLSFQREDEARCSVLSFRTIFTAHYTSAMGFPPFPSQVHGRLLTQEQTCHKHLCVCVCMCVCVCVCA